MRSHPNPLSNLVANRFSRNHFFSRYMAAQSKNSKSKARRGRPPRAGRVEPEPEVKLLPARPPVEDDHLQADDEEPKPEDLAKEEPIKPEEVEQATAVPDETPGPRG